MRIKKEKKESLILILSYYRKLVMQEVKMILKLNWLHCSLEALTMPWVCACMC